MDAEWLRLRKQVCWDEENPVDLYETLAEAAGKRDVHWSDLMELCVVKNSDLPEGHPLRKFKGRLVYRGDNVKDAEGLYAIFQELGSSPPGMEAGKSAAAYGCVEGHQCQSSDADQAYIQAEFTGVETYVRLPKDRQPEWWKTKLPHNKSPVCRLKRCLYGHPDSGGMWEKNTVMQ